MVEPAGGWVIENPVVAESWPGTSTRVAWVFRSNDRMSSWLLSENA